MDDKTIDDGKVVNLGEFRERAAKASGKASKIDRVSLIRSYANRMLKLSADLWPEFEYNLAVLVDDKGVKLPLIISEGNIVRTYSVEGIHHLITRYAELVIKVYGHEVGLRMSEVKEVYTLWIASARSIKSEDIFPVRFLNQEGYTWHRLNFDPDASVETPTFDEMFSRMENSRNVLAWVGSLFIPESSRQNYLWLHGSGGQGKSSLSGFLADIFGSAYRSEVVPNASSLRFWTSGLVGSRLVVFPDCNESWFVTDSTFKQCTGGDVVRVEYKNGGIMSQALNCKFMFISNSLPTISGLRAETRRLVYSEIAPLPDDTQIIPASIYKRMLHDERAGFIAKALEAYEDVFRGHGDLSRSASSDQEGLADLIQDNEHWCEETFREYLKIADYDIHSPRNTWPKTDATYFGMIRSEKKWSSNKMNRFYEYLSRLNNKIKRFRTADWRGTYGVLPKNAKTLAIGRNDF